MDRVGFIREIVLISQCNMAVIFVSVTERHVYTWQEKERRTWSNHRGLLFAIKQDLGGKQSEEITSFGE